MFSDSRVHELLVVCVKYPEAGRVKTRLAAEVGGGRAAEVYAGLVELSLRAAMGWLGGGRVRERRVWIYFDPAQREEAVRRWLAPACAVMDGRVDYVAQPEGDLGERLEAVFHQGFNSGFSVVMAIGSDCPSLTAEGLERASAALGGAADLAVGPAVDGGYYLIGLSSEQPAVFRGIPWSSEDTLACTRAVAARLGLRVAELERLHDVDTQADWLRWQAEA